jgi:hypothetical protein
MKKLSVLQMPFIENRGQIKNKSVRFYANTFAGTVFVTDKGEIVYSLIKEVKGQKSGVRAQESKVKNQETKAIALRESFDSQKEVSVKGIEKSETEVNYFIGDKGNWRTNIPTWQEVNLGEIYEGIELKLKVHGKNVEKLFTVYPDADVKNIKLKIEGANGLKINKDGALEIATELGIVRMTKPVAYQEVKGEKKHIQVAYKVSPGSNTYGFLVGEYDNSKPLIIDPLLASTFIGHSEDDRAFALTIDSSGDVFVAGATYSPAYPTTPGAYDESYNGTGDVFVSKLDSNLSSLLASTWIGGGDQEGASALGIDSSGNVLVAGGTYSSDYPTTPGAYDESHNGAGDVFVSKLDSNLSSLLASTFIGGVDADSTSALGIDSSGNVFVAGGTGSPDYPTTPGAYDESYNGTGDVFVSKLDSNLSGLLASTFIGGVDADYASALGIDSSGNVFVAGGTYSWDYPTTPGAYYGTFKASNDAFVSKLDNNLSSLLASTFIGGFDFDFLNALTIDSSGNVFVAGATYSPAYPTTSGAYDETYQGVFSDVFVSKFDSNLSDLLASTLIGGGVLDWADALGIDSSGNVFVAGETSSTDYPTTPGAYDETHNGDEDVFVSKLTSNLSSLLASTYIGGSNRFFRKCICCRRNIFIRLSDNSRSL